MTQRASVFYMDKTFLFASPSKLEHFRFYRFFWSNIDKKIYYSDLRTLIVLFGMDFTESKLILNGLRFPDLVLIKIFMFKKWDIILLQHNAIIPKYSSVEKIKKLWFNCIKYLSWLVYLILMILIILPKKSGQRGHVNCFCFTSDFGRAVSMITNVNLIELLHPPDMRVYGAESVNLTDEELEYFFVDEPFEKTLGISSVSVLNEALKILPENGKLNVKLHPRSKQQKYQNFEEKITIIDFFPQKVKILFTYNSNLGNYYNPIIAKYIFDKSCKRFVRYTSCESQEFHKTGYVDECQMRLKNLR